MAEHSVQAGDPDVDHEGGTPAEVGGGELRLTRHREVGSAGGRDDDETARRRRRIGRPREQPRVRMVGGVGQLGQDGGGVHGRGAREQRPSGSGAPPRDGGRDHPELLGCLALAVDRLRVAEPGQPVVVEVRDDGQRWISAVNHP